MAGKTVLNSLRLNTRPFDVWKNLSLNQMKYIRAPSKQIILNKYYTCEYHAHVLLINITLRNITLVSIVLMSYL